MVQDEGDVVRAVWVGRKGRERLHRDQDQGGCTGGEGKREGQEH